MKYPCPKNANPADYFMMLMQNSEEGDDQRHELFINTYKLKLETQILSQIGGKNTGEVQFQYMQNSCWHQINIILRRSLLNMGRNPVLILGKVS